jgi:quinol monooxygenase YgiN
MARETNPTRSGIFAGREDDGLRALEELCAATHASDEGCELYGAHRVAAEPGRVIVIETWASKEALEAHGFGMAPEARL